jgi:hypothetical protein
MTPDAVMTDMIGLLAVSSLIWEHENRQNLVKSV